MKKISFVFALSAAMVVLSMGVSISMSAQENGASRNERKTPSPDEVVDMLAGKLDLSDAQKAQIKPIIEERRQKLQSVASDNSLRRMQKGRKMKGIFKDSDKKINAVLNEEQQKKYAELEKQLREQVKDYRKNKGHSVD